MTFEARLGTAADEDLQRLFDFLLDRAETIEALDECSRWLITKSTADSAPADEIGCPFLRRAA